MKHLADGFENDCWHRGIDQTNECDDLCIIVIPSRFRAAALDLTRMSSLVPSPEISAGSKPFASDADFCLVLACCAIRTPKPAASVASSLADSSIDWQRVLRLAEHHGVGPLVCQSSPGMRDVVPQPILDELRQRYEENARRNLVFVAELFRVLDCLEVHGIEAIPYKGPVLAEEMYGDFALREFSD